MRGRSAGGDPVAPTVGRSADLPPVLKDLRPLRGVYAIPDDRHQAGRTITGRSDGITTHTISVEGQTMLADPAYRGLVEHPVGVGDVLEIRRRVVMPVVQALLRPDELDHLGVTVDAPEGGWPWPPEPGSVWLYLVAQGEEFHHQLVPSTALRETDPGPDPESGDEPDDEWDPTIWDAQAMASNLYDQLWEWIVETRFSWGEPRDGDYVIPPTVDRVGQAGGLLTAELDSNPDG